MFESRMFGNQPPVKENKQNQFIDLESIAISQFFEIVSMEQPMQRHESRYSWGELADVMVDTNSTIPGWELSNPWSIKYNDGRLFDSTRSEYGLAKTLGYDYIVKETIGDKVFGDFVFVFQLIIFPVFQRGDIIQFQPAKLVTFSAEKTKQNLKAKLLNAYPAAFNNKSPVKTITDEYTKKWDEIFEYLDKFCKSPSDTKMDHATITAKMNELRKLRETQTMQINMVNKDRVIEDWNERTKNLSVWLNDPNFINDISKQFSIKRFGGNGLAIF